MIDEFPQFISQFEWDIDIVQKNANEFITYFRHYIGGNLILNAQSEDEIEGHFFYQCPNFRPHKQFQRSFFSLLIKKL